MAGWTYVFLKKCVFHSTSSLSHYEQYCSFSPWPSGHPGGGSHLSISHCCPGQLLWSNVHPGRHLRWRQMLLHKPASSQCGFYNIKQIVFLCWCSASLQRKPHCTGTRSDIVRGVGLLCLYEWVDVYSLNLALPPFPRAFLPFAIFLWTQSSLSQARPHHHSIIFFGQLTNCKTNAYSVFQFRTF